MDLLFKRYASPFLLLDGMIKTQRMLEFVNSILEESQEDLKWEYFLHKVFGQSWDEFNEGINRQVSQAEPEKKMSEEDFETTINTSMDILSGFNPYPEP